MLVATPDTVDRFVGQLWEIRVRATDSWGYPASGTPGVAITLPDGTTLSPAPDVTADGTWSSRWTVSYLLADAGRHLATVSLAGSSSEVLQCYASLVTATADLPTAAELDGWLGGAGEHSWSDGDLQEALDSEASNQRRMCRVPAAYPPDLWWALMRRAARALAMKRQLTEQPRSDSADFDLPATMPPGRDADIRRLEGPWRKLTAG